MTPTEPDTTAGDEGIDDAEPGETSEHSSETGVGETDVGDDGE
jgi:hypothetical protein